MMYRTINKWAIGAGFFTCIWFGSVLTRQLEVGKPGWGIVIWNAANLCVFIALTIASYVKMKEETEEAL